MRLHPAARWIAGRLLTPAPATRLAATRAVHGGWTTWYLSQRRTMFRELHRGEPSTFAPVGPCRVLRAPLPPRVADVLADAALVTTAASALGVGHRVLGPLSSALLTWSLSYRNSWSMVYHNDNLVVLHSVALAAGPAADAWSVDAALRGTPSGPSGEHARYGWPLQLASATTTATYLVAGVAKVAGPLGWGWASGESLRRQIAVDGIRKQAFGDETSPVARRLYGSTALFRVFAVASLVVELAAPLVMADRRLGRAWAVGAWQMHWGIKVLMKITFRYQMSGAAYASFVDLDRPVGALLRRLHR